EVAGAFADSKGRYGYRRIKAVLKTGVSEKVVRRIMAEEGLVAHVPKRRRYSSYEGETTPAPANLVDRDFTAERPNEKWLTDISEIKARDGKGVPFADDRLLRWQDRRIHRRLQP
ncbi:IS3 family transposase, partial [Bifidobacterium breve]